MLALGVVFVNGFTDAPNAIATIVSTKTLSMNKACVLSAVCNLVGLLIMSAFNMAVASNILKGIALNGNESHALISIFLTVIVFSVISWIFSMPSSESHALVSALAGVSMALSCDASLSFISKILIYMIFSCALAFLLSILVFKIFTKASLPYDRLQIVSCATTSLMHGAQDGQKFVGILLLLFSSSSKRSTVSCIFIVCIVLFLGTLLGGGRIVKSMGNDICELNKKSAFVSDVSATTCLFLCSILGLAVSTSNVKACSIAGAGLADSQRVNAKTILKMMLTALATFPICMLISYIVMKILI